MPYRDMPKPCLLLTRHHFLVLLALEPLRPSKPQASRCAPTICTHRAGGMRSSHEPCIQCMDEIKCLGLLHTRTMHSSRLAQSSCAHARAHTHTHTHIHTHTLTHINVRDQKHINPTSSADLNSRSFGSTRKGTSPSRWESTSSCTHVAADHAWHKPSSFQLHEYNTDEVRCTDQVHDHSTYHARAHIDP